MFISGYTVFSAHSVHELVSIKRTLQMRTRNNIVMACVCVCKRERKEREREKKKGGGGGTCGEKEKKFEYRE